MDSRQVSLYLDRMLIFELKVRNDDVIYIPLNWKIINHFAIFNVCDAIFTI